MGENLIELFYVVLVVVKNFMSMEELDLFLVIKGRIEIISNYVNLIGHLYLDVYWVVEVKVDINVVLIIGKKCGRIKRLST